MNSRRTSYGKKVDDYYVKARFYRRIRTAYKDAKKRIKILHGGYKGKPGEFEKVVVPYWKRYGINPKKFWYQMFCDGKDKFEPRYIPDTMWYGTIFPYFNDLIIGRAFTDKNMYDLIFPHLRRPETLAKNDCGKFYGANQTLITREEAIQRCVNADGFIVKFTTFSSGGRNIRVFDKAEINETMVRALFDEYRVNFIIQELVKQHADLAKIHKESLNTIRVQSFFFKDEVYILSAQLRMGSGDSKVDNYTSGGYACNINADGRLNEKAVSKASGWATTHPCGIAFKDIVVPSYDKVIELVKREHKRIPQLGIIGWDFAIGEDGEPILIELNLTSETNQNGSGPAFGDMTEEVLQDVFIDKTLDGVFR